LKCLQFIGYVKRVTTNHSSMPLGTFVTGRSMLTLRSVGSIPLVRLGKFVEVAANGQLKSIRSWEARARRIIDCHRTMPPCNLHIGAVIVARRWFDLAKVVVVRWCKNLDVILLYVGCIILLVNLYRRSMSFSQRKH
jgi:hypothetical protein